MTRRPVVSVDGETALYGWLRQREERAHCQLDLTLPWTAEGVSYTGTAGRLAALRAGGPVNVPVSVLPRWAMPVGEVRWWDRAIVEPGSVRFIADDGSRWIDENGL